MGTLKEVLDLSLLRFLDQNNDKKQRREGRKI